LYRDARYPAPDMQPPVGGVLANMLSSSTAMAELDYAMNP
jgi:hypothetical protein